MRDYAAGINLCTWAKFEFGLSFLFGGMNFYEILAT